MSAPPLPEAGEHARREQIVAGALRLLDRPTPAQYLLEWTARIAATQKRETPGTLAALIFRLGGEWLALPARIFQEVAERPVIHSLPHRRNGTVAGLVSIRGELLICVSLAAALGSDSVEPPGAPQRLLVANRGGSRLAFLVSEVAAIQRYHPTELRPIPATLGESRVNFTTGLLPWKDRTVGCLDDELLFLTLARSLA